MRAARLVMGAVVMLVGGLAVGGGVGFAGGSAGSGGARAGGSAATAPSAEAVEALYGQIVEKYVASKWDGLAADLGKSKEIGAMTKEQQADVAYIRQAVAEGRPAWWDSIKQGNKVNVPTKLWQSTLSAAWDPGISPRSVSMTQTGGGSAVLSVHWLGVEMDSPDIAEHGFTKGDLAYVGIWQTLEQARLYGSIAGQRWASFDDKERPKLMRFLGFRGAVTAAYYGTPRARRWAAFLACDAFLGVHLTNEGFIPRRPLAIMLEEEIVSHPGKYPSIRLPGNQRAETVEGTLATYFMGVLERTTLTFAEDKGLREAIKEFAMANTQVNYGSGKVTLPSKMTVALDPAGDGDGAVKRGTWLMEEAAQPGVHGAAASKAGSGTKAATASRP